MVQSNTITITVTEVLGKIILAATSTSITTGQSVNFTATTYDTSNQLMSGAILTLTESSTGTTETATTDGSGVATFAAITFNSAGTYNFVASG